MSKLLVVNKNRDIKATASRPCKDVLVITIQTRDKKKTGGGSTTSVENKALANPDEVVTNVIEEEGEFPAKLEQEQPPRGDSKPAQLTKVVPVLPERYHGPGCAMEISVLEKHGANCTFRKNEGSSDGDDRVGDYHCIGRLVLQCCNAHGFNPCFCSSAKHQKSSNSQESVGAPNTRTAEDGVGSETDQQEDTGSQDWPDKQLICPDRNPDQPPDVKQSVALQDEEQPNTKLFNSDSDSGTIPSEDYVTLKPEFFDDQERQVLTVVAQPTTYNLVSKAKVKGPDFHSTKRHYPGDGCVLAHPVPPILLDQHTFAGLQEAIRLHQELKSLVSTSRQILNIKDKQGIITNRDIADLIRELRNVQELRNKQGLKPGEDLKTSLKQNNPFEDQTKSGSRAGIIVSDTITKETNSNDSDDSFSNNKSGFFSSFNKSKTDDVSSYSKYSSASSGTSKITGTIKKSGMFSFLKRSSQKIDTSNTKPAKS